MMIADFKAKTDLFIVYGNCLSVSLAVMQSVKQVSPVKQENCL